MTRRGLVDVSTGVAQGHASHHAHGHDSNPTHGKSVNGKKVRDRRDGCECTQKETQVYHDKGREKTPQQGFFPDSHGVPSQDPHGIRQEQACGQQGARNMLLEKNFADQKCGKQD